MRFLLFFFLCVQITFGQTSKTTSFAIGSSGGDPSTSHTYTTDHSKYILTVQTMPVGAISNGVGVTKLNSCDEVEWSNIYVKHAQPITRIDILQEKGSNNVYVTGLYNVQGERYLMALKLDEDGNILFSKYYDFGNYLISNFYTNYSTDNGIVVSAKYSPLGGGGSHTSLIHIDNSGTILTSTRHYDTFTGISVAQISDNQYIHRSSNILYQVNTNGQVEWAKRYGNGFAYSNFFNMVKQEDGLVMAVSRSSEHFLAKTDLNGNLLWVTDVKELSPYPPVIIENDAKEILLLTYTNYNNTSAPLIITFDADGNNLKEEVIADLGIGVTAFPSISKSPQGAINLGFPSTANYQLTYLQNVENSLCKELVSIPETENLLDVSYADYPPVTMALPLLAAYDIDMQILDLYVEDSVRCDPIEVSDTIYSEALIDCTNGYVYEGEDENSTYFWHHDESTDTEKVLDSVGIYQVDIINCYSKTVEFINVESLCGCKLKVPNAFTPNADLINDSFTIADNCGVQSFEISIYNRWGKRLFFSKNINSPWDGTYNGKAVKSDVYVYRIQYTPLSIDPLVQPEVTDGVVTVLY